MKRIWVVENALPFQRLPYEMPCVSAEGVRFLLTFTDDWEEAEVRQLCEEFVAPPYEVVALSSPSHFDRHLDSGVEPPHVVIFDWEGPGFSEEQNLDSISRVLERSFAYVQIYTHLGPAAIEPKLHALRERHRGRLLETKAKNEVSAQSLAAAIALAWQKTIAGEQADAIRQHVHRAVERLLIDLCSVEKTALAAMFGQDKSDFVTLVMAKLRDELGANGMELLNDIVKGGGAATGSEDLRRLQSAFYYHFPQDDWVRTGDLVNCNGRFAMVITPQCDLLKFNKKTAGRLTLVSAVELTRAGLEAAGVVPDVAGPSATAGHGKAGDTIVLLPNIPLRPNDRSVLTDLALLTHDWSTIRANKDGALRYADVKALSRVCAMTETFSGAVASHIGQAISTAGVPDFPQFEVARLTTVMKQE